MDIRMTFMLCVESMIRSERIYRKEFEWIWGVLIYFNDETKRQVVSRVIAALRPGGHFLVGHSESLHGINDALQTVAPAIYRRPD